MLSNHYWWQHYELWQNDGTEKQDIFEILNVSAFKIGMKQDFLRVTHI